MSKWLEKGQELAQRLEGVTESSKIQTLCDAIAAEIKEAYPEYKNSRAKPLTAVRKAIKAKFPDTTEQQNPFQYFTNSGKGNKERWEHLALKYLTRDSVGDTSEITETQPETQPETQITETQPETQITETMTITFNLTAEEQELAKQAIALTGQSADALGYNSFMAYVKSVVAQHERLKQDFPYTDAREVSTEELLTKKYNTFPGRGEELTRRAIAAIKIYNDNCTEHSQRWYISPSIVQKLTGTKAETVAKVCAQFQDDIASHHAKYGFVDPKKDQYHNRKPGQDIREQVDIVKLVPNG
ncbi:hypothetical protein [Anabaena sp. CCY 9402-a]|uniref:hypothetical protein n=1 Tax=Anabaena sp. CCY 9402-a TaxID=3103867 RepID=UPI0039C6B0C9